MIDLNLARKYRPARFEDVIGQEHPVKVLSGLIQRGKKKRDILLHGSVGSGKTSLARIYGRALNCEMPSASGSPCGNCAACQTERDYFFEHDASGRGGSYAAVEGLVSAHRRSTSAWSRVLFFDEAHNLEREASEFLLKEIEERAAELVFLFATTEAERIRPALLSRLFPLEVRPLAIDQAITLLRKIADEAGIAITRDALGLLAGLRNGYPRDLLTGLELAYDPDLGTITTHRVLTVFDLEHTQVLPQYFLALFEGDLARQSQLIFNWREPAVRKVRWLQTFLTSLYYGNLVGIRLLVDPTIEVIGEATRQQVIHKFCACLQLEGAEGIAPYWLELMKFWNVSVVEGDEAELHLRLALFNDLVNHELPRRASGLLRNLDGRRSSQIYTSGPGFGPRPVPPPGATQSGAKVEREADPAFLKVEDVRRVLNCASFLIQEHGVLFNTAIEISPVEWPGPREQEAIVLIDQFVDGLYSEMESWREPDMSPSAFIRVAEREGYRLRANLVAYVPPMTAMLEDPIGQSNERVRSFCQAWSVERGGDAGLQAVPRFAPVAKSSALKFHWDEAINLCAGLHEDVLDYHPASREWRPLYKLVRVAKPRQVGPIRQALLRVSPSLQEEAIAQASANKMGPISAFDTREWGQLRSGWEWKEHKHRRKTKQSRERALRVIELMSLSDPNELIEQKERLAADWPDDPYARTRDWIGWWN